MTYSSDVFDQLYESAEELIRRGKAYVCHCSATIVKERRGGAKHGPRSVCEHWSRSEDTNLEDCRAMRDGKYQEGEAHLRMKQYLDTKPEEYEIHSDDTPEIKKQKLKTKALAENPALWDVAAYRIKN